MNARHFVILASVAVIALAAALWSSSLREIGEPDNALLIPGLAEQINDVTELNISTAGSETVATIRRSENAWVVAQNSDYVADTGVIRGALLKLARAQILEKKTSNPDLYDRLGVEDISLVEASGKLVELNGLDEAIKIIVGNNAASTSDTYVRHVDDTVSLMIRGSLEIPTDPVEWLNRSITNIPASRVQSVNLAFSDGGQFAINKTSRDEANYEVQSIPDGRDLSSPSSPNIIATGLSELTLLGVSPASEIDIDGHAPTKTIYRCFDGLVVEIVSAEIDDKLFARLTATFDTALAESNEEVDDADTGTGGPEMDVAAINTRVTGWAYEISRNKYNQMTRRLDELLEPLPEADAAADDGS